MWLPNGWAARFMTGWVAGKTVFSLSRPKANRRPWQHIAHCLFQVLILVPAQVKAFLFILMKLPLSMPTALPPSWLALLHGWGIDEKTSAIGATTIVVGELVPTKCIAQFNAISCPADRRPLAGYSISISKSYLCRLRKMLARRTICTPASHLPRLLGTFTLIWKRNKGSVQAVFFALHTSAYADMLVL